MKIPDDVYSTRCCYCKHRQAVTENKEIPDDKLFIHFWASQSPCQIIGIAQCGKVPGECLSFKPNPMFGICQYCAYTNSFCNGFCTAPGGPVNKRRVFLGWSSLGEYWSGHALFTCDRYQVSEFWKDLILRNALEGRAPTNFDPDTWEALERLDGTPQAQYWAQLQAERAAERTAAEKKRQAERDDMSAVQLSLFSSNKI